MKKPVVRTWVLVFTALMSSVSISGCASGAASASSSNSVPKSPAVLPSSSAPTSENPQSSGWKLSLDGFGPLKLGMTADEGVATGGFQRITFCDVGALQWTAPLGTDYVIANLNEQGIVWNISISGSPSPLDSGVGPGTSAETLKKTYGDSLIADVANPTYSKVEMFAVNGANGHLVFVVDKSTGLLSPQDDINLVSGTATASTIENMWSCKAAWRK